MNSPWVKQIEEAVDEAKLIPLWGEPPAFPWEEFADHLSKTLNLPDLRIELEKSAWKKPEEYLAGLGEEPHLFTFELLPLAEPVFFAISSEDARKLMARCLSEGRGVKGFSHPDFQEGFLHYLWLQALDLCDQLKCFSDLSPKLGKKHPLPKKEGGFCLDLALILGRETLRGRILCPSAFHHAFRAHFSQHKPSLADSPLAKETLLSLRLEIGNTSLSQNQWEKVEIGDMVILDRCSFDPDQQKGSIDLVLNKTPLMRGRIKEKSLKILDYAFTNEETMSPPPDEENDVEQPIEEGSEGSHLWSSNESQGGSVETLLSAEEIPLTLTVEIGRLKMSIEKLLQLKPGNLLELGLSPEQGVHLTIEGKRIARGELVKIGELLGVRILEIKR